MKCRNCQKKIDKNLEKCPYCGTLLHDKKQNKKEVTPEEKIARGLVGVEGAAISGAIYASTKDTREKIGKNIKEKGAGYLGSKEFLNDLTGNHGANYASYETPNYDNVTSITAEAPTYMSSSTGTNGDSYVDFNSLYDSNGDVNYQIVNDFLNGSSSGEQLMTFLDSLSDAEAEQITGSIINALKDYMGNITGFDGLSNEDFAKLLSEYANIENGGNGKITKEALENFISEELNKQFKDLGKNIEFHLSENVLNFEEAGITVSEENGVKIYTDKDGNTFNSLEELVANHPETIDMVKVLNENGISTTLSRSELEKKLTDIINKQLEENGYDYKIVFDLSEKVLDLKKGNISKETDADGNVIYKDKDGKVYKSLEELVAAHPEIIDIQKVLEENGYDTKTPNMDGGGAGGGGRIDIDPMYLGYALDTLGGPKITGSGSLTGWDCINKKANAITSISFPSGSGKGNAYTAPTYKSPPASFSGLSGLCGSICAGFGLTGGGGGIDISAFLEQLHAQLSDLKSKIDDIDDTSIFNEEEKEAFYFSLDLTASERADANGGYEGYDGTKTFENHEQLLKEAEKHKDAAYEYILKQADADFDANYSKIMKENYMEMFESEFAQKYFEEHGALPKKGDPGYEAYKKQLNEAARAKYIETVKEHYDTRLEISNQNMYLNYNSAIIKAGMHSFEVDTGEAIIKDGVITFKDGTKMSQEEYNKEMAMFEAIKADYLKGERGNIQNLEGYEKYLSGIGTYIYNSVYAQQYRDASDAYEKALQEYNDLKDPVNGISQRWGGTSGEYRDKLSAAEEELKRCEAAKNNYELKYTETTYKILAQYIYNENYYDIEYFNEQLAELEANYKAEMSDLYDEYSSKTAIRHQKQPSTVLAVIRFL